MPLLEVKNVKKIYTTRFGGAQVQALSAVNFSVERGEYVAIMGESGRLRCSTLSPPWIGLLGEKCCWAGRM